MSHTTESADDWDSIPSWFMNVLQSPEPPAPASPTSQTSSILDNAVSPAGVPTLTQSPGLV